MPHLILECHQQVIDSIDFAEFFHQSHHYLADTLPTKVESCKSRVYGFAEGYVGDGLDARLLFHLTVKILPGRSDDIKSTVVNQLVQSLQAYLNSKGVKGAAVSVELADLSTHYCKN